MNDIEELDILIPSTKQIILDLNGKQINGGDTPEIITNYGKLTIEDSIGGAAIVSGYFDATTISNSGELTIQSGIIKAEQSVAIWNGGTLKIGLESDGFSRINPQIISNYGAGISNSGTMYFYNGAITGKSKAISGNTPTLRSGYTIDTFNSSTGIQTVELKQQ